VKRERKPGLYADGRNLYLYVQKGQGKSWLFIYRFGGKQREMGLGSFDNVPLAKARELAEAARHLLGQGKDPIEERRRPSSVPTFGERADAFITANKDVWKNAKHAAQWEMTLRKYAAPIREKRVDQVTTADIFAILEPIWKKKHDTAVKVRGRIEAVLESARSLGHFSGDNPASRRVLKALLADVPKSKKHFPAMKIEQVPDFMQELRARTGVSARALEYTILTAARTGEVIKAKWGEFDGPTWTTPAKRMKARKDHQVPLCERPRQILAEMRELGQPYVFPGRKKERPLSNAAMAKLLKEMREEVTVHGFRSTFRDWASEHTEFSHEVCEMALAHVVENETEAAYRRGDLFVKRYALMKRWAEFCAGELGQVLSLADRIRAEESESRIEETRSRV
jgi:integrase